MIKEGLADFEDHPEKILAHALRIYGKNRDFEKQRFQLEANYDEILVKIVRGHGDTDRLIEEFGENIGKNNIERVVVDTEN